MPWLVVCGGCKKKLKVAENLVGKAIRCPGCAKTMVVPKPKAPVAAPTKPAAAVKKAAGKPSPSTGVATVKKVPQLAAKPVSKPAVKAAVPPPSKPAAKPAAAPAPAVARQPPFKPAAADKKSGASTWVFVGVGGVLLLGLGWFFFLRGEAVGQATGKISWKGEPVGGAELVFQATEKPDEQYSGNAGEDGAYQVSYRMKQGMPVGTYRITITRSTLPSGKSLPEGEAGQVLQERGGVVKESYVFTKEIVSGSNDLSFELTEGEKQKPAK